MKQSQRIEWIDVLKCIVMWLVVVGHTSRDDTPDTLRFYIYAFHMPLFFLISGMTFRLQCRKRDFDFKGIVKNKAQGLLWPYFILSMLTIPMWLVNYRVLSYRDQSIGNLIYGIIYGNQYKVLSPTNAMWFCLTLFLTIVLFWMIYKKTQGDEKKLAIIVFIIALGGYILSVFDIKVELPWHLDTVPIALLFVWMGWFFIEHIDKIQDILGDKKKQAMWLVLLIPIAFFSARFNEKISMAMNDYGLLILFVCETIAFSLIFIIVAKNIKPLEIFKFIGRNTIVILAFHSPVFRFMERYSQATADFYHDFPILAGSLVFLAMIPLCYIFERYLPVCLGKFKK